MGTERVLEKEYEIGGLPCFARMRLRCFIFLMKVSFLETQIVLVKSAREGELESGAVSVFIFICPFVVLVCR